MVSNVTYTWFESSGQVVGETGWLGKFHSRCMKRIARYFQENGEASTSRKLIQLIPRAAGD